MPAPTPGSWRRAAFTRWYGFTYEGCSIVPAGVTDIEIHEPLRSWLAQHAPEAAP